MSIREIPTRIGAAAIAALAVVTLTTGPAAASTSGQGSATTVKVHPSTTSRAAALTGPPSGDTVAFTSLNKTAGNNEPVCSVSVDGVNWGGEVLCNYGYTYNYFTNGLLELYVVATNFAVYTRYETATGIANWVSLGGQVERASSDPSNLAYLSPWLIGNTTTNTPTVWVYGNTPGNVQYYRTRSAAGVWSAWARG